MPGGYPPEVRRHVIERARAGTRVAQLAATFGMSEVTVYDWLKQDRIDRGEEIGQTTDQQLELAAAKTGSRSASDPPTRRSLSVRPQRRI